MRTTFVMVVVIIMGITSLMFAGSGFNSAVGMDRAGSVGDEVSGTAQSEGIFGAGGQFDTGEAGDDGMFGLVVGGASIVLEFFSLGGVFDDTLKALGFPDWFADPIGVVAQILLTIGFIQWVTGRYLR